MKLTSKLLATAALLTASATAMAHPGHTEGGFTSGLLHPMLGLDHLLAMAAIGFWSVRQSKLMKNATPAFVIGGMVFGAALAWGGLRNSRHCDHPRDHGPGCALDYPPRSTPQPHHHAPLILTPRYNIHTP